MLISLYTPHTHTHTLRHASCSSVAFNEKIWIESQRSTCILSYFHCHSTFNVRWKWHKCEFHSTTPNFLLLLFLNEWQRWDSHSNDLRIFDKSLSISSTSKIDGRRLFFHGYSISHQFRFPFSLIFNAKCDEKWYRLPSCTTNVANDFVCFPITLPPRARTVGKIGKNNANKSRLASNGQPQGSSVIMIYANCLFFTLLILWFFHFKSLSRINC